MDEPYRYINSTYSTGWGNAGGDKNYENSHPDWLIKWENNGRTWTILNPALPEVKQRIIDVTIDLISKYDVDGVVFDDYSIRTVFRQAMTLPTMLNTLPLAAQCRNWTGVVRMSTTWCASLCGNQGGKALGALRHRPCRCGWKACRRLWLEHAWQRLAV